MSYYGWEPPYNQWNSHYPGPERPRQFKNRQQFMMDLERGLHGEAEAIAFYTSLLRMAPDDLARRNIRHALEDERKHYRQFSELYRQLTGMSPEVPIPPPAVIPDYRKGLIEAFEDELEAAELYRGMYLNALTRAVRDLMFEIMTDEMEHADRFALLYAATKEDLEEEEKED
ncbi:ferritin-like domain-containing protein [Zhaonella formicivorans]|uniref:ferritin-like domain-containing protein n=1 Tax=Zhaonella formicivorans TaxID=2528593 RepID=UPI0010D78472|nr:ferritin-like domain-containing protein [Zhaonella formicivorans]